MKKWKERDVENHRAKGKITLGCGNPKCDWPYCPETGVELPIRKVVSVIRDKKDILYQDLLKIKKILGRWADHLQIPKDVVLRGYSVRVRPIFDKDGVYTDYEHSVGFYYDGTPQKQGIEVI